MSKEWWEGLASPKQLLKRRTYHRFSCGSLMSVVAPLTQGQALQNDSGKIMNFDFPYIHGDQYDPLTPSPLTFLAINSKGLQVNSTLPTT